MKAYVKPELFYERYELSQHIANCDIEVQSGDVNNCYGLADAGLGFDGLKLFTDSNVCSTIFEAYCITNSSSDVGVTFQS